MSAAFFWLVFGYVAFYPFKTLVEDTWQQTLVKGIIWCPIAAFIPILVFGLARGRMNIGGILVTSVVVGVFFTGILLLRRIGYYKKRKEFLHEKQLNERRGNNAEMEPKDE